MAPNRSTQGETMKDSENLHQKLQELCNCFADTHPLGEMSNIKGDGVEDALKWLALATLHGLGRDAEEITLTQTREGKVNLQAVYREARLPAPHTGTASKIFEVIQSITHIQKDNGHTDLAMGIRDSSLNLNIRLRDKGDHQALSIRFPK